MPLTTQQFDLEETLEQKYNEREEVAAEAAQLDTDNPAFGDKSRRGNTLDTHIKGLEWAIDNWDVDSITLVGLTGGEYANLENEVHEGGNGAGASRIATIVHGTEGAPYLTDEEKTTYYEIGQLPYDLQRWLEDEINSMTSPGNLETTFAQRVAEMRHQEDGTDD